ncbi:hypothetical protein J23TS9_16760 [Paenibacillus sp. J23TS9]|nr:hypothetical protein J23TS9_16760 [Paenibacillus sp. J23TS9]
MPAAKAPTMAAAPMRSATYDKAKHTISAPLITDSVTRNGAKSFKIQGDLNRLSSILWLFTYSDKSPLLA